MAFDLDDPQVQLILDRLEEEDLLRQSETIEEPVRNINNVIRYEQDSRNTFIEVRTQRRQIDAAEFRKLIDTDFEEII